MPVLNANGVFREPDRDGEDRNKPVSRQFDRTAPQPILPDRNDPTTQRIPLLPNLKIVHFYEGFYGFGRAADGSVVTGGIEQVIKRLSEHYAARLGMEIHVICKVNDRPVTTTQRFASGGSVTIHGTPELGQQHLAHSVASSRLLREIRPDVVHLHSPSTPVAKSVATTAQSIRCGLVVTYHSAADADENKFKHPVDRKNELWKLYDIYEEHVRQRGPTGLYTATVDLARRILRRRYGTDIDRAAIYEIAERRGYTLFGPAGGLIAVSSESQQVFRGRPSQIIGVPVDVDLFTRDNLTKEELDLTRKEYNPDGRKLVVYPSRITEQKGQHLLVEAAHHLRTLVGDGFRVVIAGPHMDSTYVSRVQSEIASRGLQDHVTLGAALPQRKVCALLACADVMAFPTRREALGSAAIEAQLLELPVVAFKVGGVPEVVRDGLSGFLVSDGDVATMATKVSYLLQHPDEAKAFGRSGRIRCLERFSLDSIADQYLQRAYLPQAHTVRAARLRN